MIKCICFHGYMTITTTGHSVRKTMDLFKNIEFFFIKLKIRIYRSQFSILKQAYLDWIRPFS